MDGSIEIISINARIALIECENVWTLAMEASSEPPHPSTTTSPTLESRLAQNEWSKQLQHGVNEACEPPVLADRQLEGCSAMTSTRSKFMIERQNHQFAQARDQNWSIEPKQAYFRWIRVVSSGPRGTTPTNTTTTSPHSQSTHLRSA